MKMKTYNLKVSEYSGFTDIEMKIPDGVKFFFDEEDYGPVHRENCNHYTTVVDKGIYEDWIEEIEETEETTLKKRQ